MIDNGGIKNKIENSFITANSFSVIFPYISWFSFASLDFSLEWSVSPPKHHHMTSAFLLGAQDYILKSVLLQI